MLSVKKIAIPEAPRMTCLLKRNTGIWKTQAGLIVALTVLPILVGLGLSISERSGIEVALTCVGKAIALMMSWWYWSIFLSLASLLIGMRVDLRAAFAGAVWAGLPATLRGLVQTGYILLTQDLPGAPGLSGFIQGESIGSLLSQEVLAHLDLFSIWSAALLVVAAEGIFTLPRRRALAIVFLGWLLYALASSLPGLIPVLFHPVGL